MSPLTVNNINRSLNAAEGLLANNPKFLNKVQSVLSSPKNAKKAEQLIVSLENDLTVACEKSWNKKFNPKLFTNAFKKFYKKIPKEIKDLGPEALRTIVVESVKYGVKFVLTGGAI